MKRAIGVALLFSALAVGQEQDPVRQAVERFYGCLARHDAAAAASMFAVDGSARGLASSFGSFGSLETVSGRKNIENSLAEPRPWSEVIGPYLRSQRVHDLTPDMAVVDAVAVFHSSSYLDRQSEATLVLIKKAGTWLIASYRGSPPQKFV